MYFIVCFFSFFLLDTEYLLSVTSQVTPVVSSLSPLKRKKKHQKPRLCFPTAPNHYQNMNPWPHSSQQSPTHPLRIGETAKPLNESRHKRWVCRPDRVRPHVRSHSIIESHKRLVQSQICFAPFDCTELQRWEMNINCRAMPIFTFIKNEISILKLQMSVIAGKWQQQWICLEYKFYLFFICLLWRSYKYSRKKKQQQCDLQWCAVVQHMLGLHVNRFQPGSSKVVAKCCRWDLRAPRSI